MRDSASTIGKLATAAAAALVIAACGGETARSGKLEVVDSGAEPRVKFQYAIGKLDRDIAFVSTLKEQPFGDMRYQVHCDGAGSCRYQMVKFEVMGQGSAFESAKKDITGTISMPPTGLATIKADKMMRTTPSTPELFKAAIVPLPSDPVGVGARWKVIDGDATNSFRLVHVAGPTLTIETRAEAGNAQMKVEARGEMTVKLTDPFGTGTLAIVQTVAAAPSLKMDAHSINQTMKIE